MLYINYETLCKDIRSNLIKIPRDIDGVIGIPRSGMLPATIIAEYLNIGCTSLDAIIDSGYEVTECLSRHGGRGVRMPNHKRLLIIDDTCSRGSSLSRAKKKVDSPLFKDYELIWMAVYLEGGCDICKPDLWLRDIREGAKKGPFGWAIYEWNLFAHGKLTDATLFDLDGVICVEPPDERDTEKYIEYIKNPIPLYVPTGNKISICTYRLEKYRQETEESLRKIGIENFDVKMCNVPSYEARKLMPSWEYKAFVYADRNWKLFVESNDFQARKIYEATGKPVISIEKNLVYS